MSSITIEVEGQEFETIKIELTEEEVKAIYQQRKEQSKTIEDQGKSYTQLENSHKYEIVRREKAESELAQANMLLSALGVEDKTKEEDSWSRQPLPVATRIALYIARINNASVETK